MPQIQQTLGILLPDPGIAQDARYSLRQRRMHRSLVQSIALVEDARRGAELECIIQRLQPRRKVADELIIRYHEQGLAQANVQFWLGVCGAALGFILLFYLGIETSSESLPVYLKTLPGSIGECVSYLFFYEAAKTRKRATELYDRLRTDEQHRGAVSMVDSIEDPKLKDKTKADIARYMAGLCES